MGTLLLSVGSIWLRVQTDEKARFPKMMYTIEGKKAMERLWVETMVELEFANVREILTALEKC